VKDDIERRFESNLDRVRGLIASYRAALPGISGRPPVTTVDLLRGGVVFLHASLEDLVRSVLEWKLPDAAAASLDEVPLIGCAPRTKFTLAELATFRGSTVKSVIGQSVDAWLLRSNFNNSGEIIHALGKVGIGAAVVAPHASNLEALMKRRHWIVHRADRNQMQGSGQHAAQSLQPSTVDVWLNTVQTFGRDLLALL
jgi:hypothetical protein